MKESSSRTDAIISATIGAIVEVVLAFLLANFAQLTSAIAFVVAFHIAFVAFLALWCFVVKNRIQKQDVSTQTVKADVAGILGAKRLGTQDELIAVLGEMGIVGATTKMSDSKFEPTQCMAQARRTLFFMGILGSKWVIPPHVRSEFKQFLNRIRAQNGLVRFLLINPKGQAFDRVKSLREGAISDESLEHFRNLMDQFDCLEVRLYDQIPCFRLVFIDEKLVAVSRYKIDKQGYFQSKFGWEAPHLIVDSSAPWSLYDAFELLYEQNWSSSKDLRNILGRARR